MATASLRDAVRMLRAAEPALGVKPLVTKLHEQLPGEEVGAKEVREALRALAAESEASAAAAEVPPAADGIDAPSHAAQDLACLGCGVLTDAARSAQSACKRSCPARSFAAGGARRSAGPSTWSGTRSGRNGAG